MVDADGVVQAAGAVVWRDHEGQLEVLLIHRPRYDDWTFPKGKLEAGERHEEGAIREIEEETGLRVDLGPEVAICRYTDHRQRPKSVHYFAASVPVPAGAAPEFVVNQEVDRLEWLRPDDATTRLSYARDREVLVAFRERFDAASLADLRTDRDS